MRINGKKIKKLREEKGMTGEELRRKAGYSGRSSICEIENGSIMPRADKLAKIAYQLDCFSEDLLIAEKGDY